MTLRTLRDRLLDLLFPPKCVFCRRLLEDGEVNWCSRCQETLPWMEEDAPPKLCAGLSGCASPLWYRDDVRKSFHRYKFSGRSFYAKPYGRLMAQCAHDRLEGGWELVTWVPLSARRRRERGYDQAELLARAAAAELGLTPEAVLRKTRHTTAQSSLRDAAERADNAAEAYRVVDPARVAGKRVLLVDDVVTTGSTLSQCALALRQAGAADVTGLTFARARQ